MKTALLLLVGLCAACAGRSLGPPEPAGQTPPVDSPTGSGARFYWADSVGFTGAGEAIEVLGTGVIHGWGEGSDPSANTRAPDYTGSVEVKDAGDLFAIMTAVDFGSLPHGVPTAECSVVGEVRACTGCKEEEVQYDAAKQVEPELDGVWAWFDQHPELAPYSPKSYCDF